MKEIRRTVPVYVPESSDGTGPWAGTAELAYLPRDPLAVHLLIDGRRWAWLRDLFADGLDRQVGVGDVTIRPLAGKGEKRVEVVLSSPDGRAALWFLRRDVTRLLAAAFKAVPKGREHEHMDWDTTIAALLPKGDLR